MNQSNWNNTSVLVYGSWSYTRVSVQTDSCDLLYTPNNVFEFSNAPPYEKEKGDGGSGKKGKE